MKSCQSKNSSFIRNCLFRALGDQLDGHMGNHYRHRQDTTNYMLEHRDNFQPFVEDDLPFEKHSTKNFLKSLITYLLIEHMFSQWTESTRYICWEWRNCCICKTSSGKPSFALVLYSFLCFKRSLFYQKVTIVIHQPNTPLWQIKGWETCGTPKTTDKNKKQKNYSNLPLTHQLHIAYHGGDHYDSVRRLGDTSHNPANIQIDVENEEDEGTSQSPSTTDYVQDYDSCNINDMDHAEEAVILIQRYKKRQCFHRSILFNN